MTQAVTLAQLGGADTTLPFRNRIINGDMRIAQRGTASVNSHNSFIVDRWGMTNVMDSGVFTAQQSSDVPSGMFNNSIVCTVTTAQASVATTSNYASIRHKIEGYNISGFGQGTAAATSSTLSFWVKASQTGTWCVQLTNGGGSGDQFYLATYTINSSNTWEYKTITVAGNTGGTWNTTNGIGLQVWWTLASGTDYQSATTNTWVTSATSLMKTSAQNNFFATNGNTFYITGVQLETGTVATPFERRPYGMELALCQRYYQDFRNTSNNGGGPLTNYMVSDATRVPLAPCLVTMRTSPTITPYTTAGTSGSLTQFSAATNIVATANPLSNNYQGGCGYWQMASSITNPVYQMNTYSAEL